MRCTGKYCKTYDINTALQGKRILLTGGGTGLGKEIARGFAAHGAVVYICGRRVGVLTETAAELSRETGGVVIDVWVDRAEALIRYLQVEVTTSAGTKRVLLPLPFAKIDGRRSRVWVNAILGSQFADVPVTKSLDQVTKLEEDRIVGYYGAGTLYATTARQEPLL